MQLIGRAHHGALGELYDRYCRLVYSVAYGATNDPHLAEEITQDTFLRVWQRAESFNPHSGKASSWLAGIARNRAIDLYRRRQVRSDGHADSIDAMPHFEVIDDAQAVEASVEESQDRERVRRALGQLPEEQRQALALAYFRGLTQSQIAQTLGLPLGTVKTRIRLGMQKLRELL
jgi:RNA polymerase sigma-70 factor (ECF subfamily)